MLIRRQTVQTLILAAQWKLTCPYSVRSTLICSANRIEHWPSLNMASKSLGSSYMRDLCRLQCPWLQVCRLIYDPQQHSSIDLSQKAHIEMQPVRTLNKASLVSPASRRSIYTSHIDSFRNPNPELVLQSKRSSNHADRLYQFPKFSGQSRRASRLAKSMLPRSGSTAETYVAYGMTQKLFEACSSQADYRIPQLSQKGAQVPKTEAGEDLGVGEGWWYEELGLAPTFSTWSQVTFLHMYLLTVRLRALPSHESLQTYSRHLIDHFSHNAEERMDILHGLTSRAIRNKFLKDLFIQWRGILAAYDEGLVKGDAVLGAAIWRNLWKASHNGPDGKDMDWTKVAWVVAYMRRVLSELSQVSEGDLILTLGHRSGGKPGIFGYSELDKKLVDAKR